MTGIKKLNKQEINDYSLKTKTSESDETIMAWINSFGGNIKVNNLERDLSSGVVLLKIIDRIKKNSVKWKRVRTNIKSPFDKTINCNYVINLCQQQLKMEFVNVGGEDIVYVSISKHQRLLNFHQNLLNYLHF